MNFKASKIENGYIVEIYDTGEEYFFQSKKEFLEQVLKILEIKVEKEYLNKIFNGAVDYDIVEEKKSKKKKQRKSKSKKGGKSK